MYRRCTQTGTTDIFIFNNFPMGLGHDRNGLRKELGISSGPASHFGYIRGKGIDVLAWSMSCCADHLHRLASSPVAFTFSVLGTQDVSKSRPGMYDPGCFLTGQ